MGRANTKATPKKRFYSKATAARALDCDVDTVGHRIDAGEFNAWREPTGRIVIDADQFDAYLETLEPVGATP